MFHVLEHVADPLAILSQVQRWLVPGAGTLVVEVPNVASTVQAPRHRFHFAHLHSFTSETLGAFGRAAGLLAVRAFTSGDGGNIWMVWRRPGEPVAHGLPGPMPANVTSTREVLRAHTTVRHYASLVPYRRAVGRLRRRLAEDRLLRRYPTVEAILAAQAASRLH
jgi:hypothetical protein